MPDHSEQDPWKERIIDWLQRSPVVTSTGSQLVAIFCTWLLDKGPAWTTRTGQAWSAGLGLVIALSVAVTAIVAERTKTLRARRTTTKLIRRLLSTLAHECGHPKCHLRANITLCDEACNRRTVDRATAFNMTGDGDQDLNLEFGAGVSGKAARLKKGTIGDLTATANGRGPDWGLQPEQQAKVRAGLKTILSVPILDADSRDTDNEPKVIGTLQIDSDCSIEELAWDEGTIDRAQRFADLVALHLEHKL